MRGDIEWPDTARVLDQLKGFQRDTVEWAFHRLYHAEDSSHRFLVADEVGLGKTLVARGVIAKAVEHLRNEGVERIDVIYICSNASIARQNINRLNLTGNQRFQLASRITELPESVRDLKENRINFISLTPGTSFDLRSKLGRAPERVLLYWMLRLAWGDYGAGALNVLQGNQGKDRFRKQVKAFDPDVIDTEIQRSFEGALEQSVGTDASHASIRSRFGEACERYSRARKTKRPREDRQMRSRVVGTLRSILARVCIEALEPDLIIMDEFQRFRHLLSGDDEAAELARDLFTYSDDQTKVRTLLLSATPYKMYTLHHESDEDDHYADFLKTVGFLENSPGRGAELGTELSDLRRQIYRLGEGGERELPALIERIEARLRRIMARTERVGSTEAGDSMLAEVPTVDPTLRSDDVLAYVELQHIADELGQPRVLEYWKSSPYLLNFMDRSRYKLKAELVARSQGATDELPARDDSPRSTGRALLRWEDVLEYGELDPRNARMRDLIREMLDPEYWRLLWIPPSLPYYELAPRFERARQQGLTKRLVFSSWSVVPKAIGTLLSYEAERRVFGAFEESPQNTAEARARRRGLLRFARSEGRLSGMPVLGLLYPSLALAELADPLAFARQADQISSAPSQEELLAWAGARIAPHLEALHSLADPRGGEDEAWYWAAPILLDLNANEQGTRAWLARADAPQQWSGHASSALDEEADGMWAAHVDAARELAEGAMTLGPMPSDLAGVLARMAVAAPGTAALRALSRVAGQAAGSADFARRDAAGSIAWSFRSLFNQPESMASLRSNLDSELPYWRNVIEYCLGGGLPSVLDEYAHVLRDSLGVAGRDAETIVEEVAEVVRDSVSIRASVLDVDEIRLGSDSGTRSALTIHSRSMRARFAVRFGSDKQEDKSSAQRDDAVRAAFNSPFWPFVLATTSVGQEGLDFHPYCHAVVHWNLPANPVDLEQREGRVHRYKGHAIRKNVASMFGADAIHLDRPDPWDAAFSLAAAEAERHSDGTDGLIPYWVFAPEGGALIQRHVPALPLSRDRIRLESLRRSLAAYRMVFGQPRQDDLLAYLLERLDDDAIEKYARTLRIDLRPVGPGANT